jgi:hypothetical protein
VAENLSIFILTTMAMGILMTTTPFMGMIIPIPTPMTTIIVIRGMIQGLTVPCTPIATNMDMVCLTTITPGIPMTTIMHIITTSFTDTIMPITVTTTTITMAHMLTTPRTHTGMDMIYQVLMCTGKKGWAYGSFSY